MDEEEVILTPNRESSRIKNKAKNYKYDIDKYKYVDEEEQHLLSDSNEKLTISTTSSSSIVLNVKFVAILGLILSTVTLGILIVKTTDSSSPTNDNDNNDITTDSGRPHLVVMIIDDLALNSVGYENYDFSGLNISPHIDSLADSGIKLTNFYAQEVCTPSRAAFLTGRYPLTIGMQYGVVSTNTAWGLNLDETVLPEVLQKYDYVTHLIGKWHLGHHSPRYLPTARGFDYFTGYIDGSNYYWSKRNPVQYAFKDFMTSNSSCYMQYVGDELHSYSTRLYRDIAIDIIEEHDKSLPLYLQLSFQAVHTPFDDDNTIHQGGIPATYLDATDYKAIKNGLTGNRRIEYALSLKILDNAIGDIVDALEDQHMLNSTYIILFSDNGGCKYGGGKNYPYRGMKASLFEGGSKVDAIFYSQQFDQELQGTSYDNLMHISDLFPTMLSMAGITYTAPDGYELDGIDHYSAITDAENTDVPRDTMLYNSYYDVDGYSFDRWTSGPFAIRDLQYKLIHTYNSSEYGAWDDYSEVVDDDGINGLGDCKQNDAIDGDYFFALYDLLNDPYETTNIYDSTSLSVIAAKQSLYTLLDYVELNSVVNVDNWMNESSYAEVHWTDECNNYVCPWVSPDTDVYSMGITDTYPNNCGSTETFVHVKN